MEDFSGAAWHRRWEQEHFDHGQYIKNIELWK